MSPIVINTVPSFSVAADNRGLMAQLLSFTLTLIIFAVGLPHLKNAVASLLLKLHELLIQQSKLLL